MFKLNIPIPSLPLTSKGGILLFLVTSSLLIALRANNVGAHDEIQSQTEQDMKELKEVGKVKSSLSNLDGNQTITDKRLRSGRLFTGYSGGSSSLAANQHQLDTYAAAYAAANSPNNPLDQVTTSSDYHQQNGQSQTSEPMAYTSSFGELLEPTSNNGQSVAGTSSIARHQMVNEFGPTSGAHHQQPSASFYAGYMSPSSNEASYATNHLHNAAQSSSGQHYKSSHQPPQVQLPIGYPINAHESTVASNFGFSDRFAAHHQALPFWTVPSSHGLLSSASHVLSHWTHGLSISEIICGLIALSIGAIILGAPFFLIYLVLMGNFSGSGTLSLTNPTQSSTTPSGSSTTVNGRKKRLAIFEPSMNSDDIYKAPEYLAIADSIVKHIRPYVDLKQVSSSLKRLIRSIEEYSRHDEVNRSSSLKLKSS